MRWAEDHSVKETNPLQLISRCPFVKSCCGSGSKYKCDGVNVSDTYGGGDGTCVHAHGLWCGVCDVDYYRASLGQCEACPEHDGLAIKITLAVLAVLALIVGMERYLRSGDEDLRKVIEKLEEGPAWERPLSETDSERSLRRSSRLSRKSSWSRKYNARLLKDQSLCGRIYQLWTLRPDTLFSDVAAIVKVLVGYAQVMHVFTRYNYVLWPKIFLRFLELLNINFSIDLLIPSACISRHQLSHHTYLNITLALPLLFSALIFTLATSARWWHAWRSMLRRGETSQRLEDTESQQLGSGSDRSGTSSATTRTPLPQPLPLWALLSGPLVWTLHFLGAALHVPHTVPHLPRDVQLRPAH